MNRRKGSTKIKKLEELVEILDPLRAARKTIVHCHGVFDLLHIGHIRHLEQARSFGDILVVTVTPDRFVNKGPTRPAFTEMLRLDALAALECVDYVALNEWPMTVETLKLLKPHFYVKGQSYQDADKDVTGGITLEEAAARSVGGELRFTDGITFSSSGLINRYLPQFPADVSAYLERFRGRHSAAEVLSYLEQARGLRVLVVGEAIIDEYHYCEAIGKSSKDPMLAVLQTSSEKFAGGALAIANHVAQFCDRVGLFAMLGAEHSHEAFIRQQLAANITPTFFFREDGPTIVKRRYVENYFFVKLLSVYEMNDNVLTSADEQRMQAALREHMEQYDLLIVADFGHQMVSRRTIDILCKSGRILAVNSQANASNHGYHTISRYPRADFISLAENEARLEARDRHGPLPQAVADIAKKIDCGKIVVTRGKKGSLAFSREEGFVESPALAGQVVDRLGAGDASFAITSLCIAQEAPMEVVAFIGNAVGAQAVLTVGNRQPIDRVGLIKQIDALLK